MDGSGNTPDLPNPAGEIFSLLIGGVFIALIFIVPIAWALSFFFIGWDWLNSPIWRAVLIVLLFAPGVLMSVSELRSNLRWTPLQKAAFQGDLAVVEALIEGGADVDEKAYKNTTALPLAVEQGHEAVVRALLAVDARVNVIGHVNLGSPLALASVLGHVEIARLLLQHGANVEQTDLEGAAPLFIAAQHGQRDIVDVLLDAGADSSATAPHGATPLIVAAQFGHGEVIRKLLKSDGTPIDARGRDGATALMVAAQEGHSEIVGQLLDSGADPNIGLTSGSSPLIAAAYLGAEQIVYKLIARGARLDAKTDAGASAKDVARGRGHITLAAYLEGEMRRRK